MIKHSLTRCALQSKVVQKREEISLCALNDTKHRYSPAAIDMHLVLDMSLQTRYVLRTRKNDREFKTLSVIFL